MFTVFYLPPKNAIVVLSQMLKSSLKNDSNIAGTVVFSFVSTFNTNRHNILQLKLNHGEIAQYLNLISTPEY